MRYETKIIETRITLNEAELNHLGEERWHLCCILVGTGINHFQYILQREKKEKEWGEKGEFLPEYLPEKKEEKPEERKHKKTIELGV